jgi:hypothetical protein
MSTYVTTATTGAQNLDLSKRPSDMLTTISNTGTYTTLVFTFQASVDGTNFFNVGAIDNSSGAFITGGTSIAPTNSTTNSWTIQGNFAIIRAKLSGLASVTALTFSQQSSGTSGGAGGGTPISVNTNAGLSLLPDHKYATGTTTTTFTAAQMTGGKLTVYNSTATTPGSIATPTATAMFAAQPSAAIGQTWVVRFINSSGSANTMTITADASVTLSGTTTHTVAQFAMREYLMTFTSATAATMVAIGACAGATN